MKYVQYVNEEGLNAYIPFGRIMRITEEGTDKSSILLSDQTEALTLNIKPLDLIVKLNEEGANVIVTEQIYSEASTDMLQRAMQRSVFGSMGMRRGSDDREAEL